ncbi:MAG: EamA family transporter [Thermotogota bacterium]
MIYLFLAILSSSAIALIFKHSENNNMNRFAITTMNYVIAFSTSLIIILSNFKNFRFEDKTLDPIMHNLINNIKFNEFTSFIWAIIIGSIAGAFFFLSFFLYQKSIRENGVGLSGAFGKLGILIPMVFSIIFWKEYPNTIQTIGISFAIFAIIFINIPFKKEKLNFNYLLILLFLFGGMAEFSNKFFQNYSFTKYKEIFLFFVFFSAFLISLFFTLKKPKKVHRRDIITGILVGIPNYFSSFFLIMALDYVKTSVAFPIFSSGSILFINLGGIIIFKEFPSKKDWIAIVSTIIALILMNIRM